MESYTWIELANMHLSYGATFTSGHAAQRIDIQTVGFLIIRHFPAFIADYANRGQYTDEKMAKDEAFVRTPEAEEAMLQYVENKVPLALKRSVAAHRFLKKICFNEGYLSGPKVCWSNLETPCIVHQQCLQLHLH